MYWNFLWKLALNYITFCSVSSAIFLHYHVADASLIAVDISANRKQQKSLLLYSLYFQLKQVLILSVKAKRKLQKIGQAA